MAIVGVIPARGGSKSIPKKSIANCAGQPLLSYTCQAALASRLDRVILSTDDPEIAAVGKQYGVEVPFLRPPELARDETPMLPVLQHLLQWLTQTGESITAIVLLQPTSPLRRSVHIDEALELFFQSQAETVVSVVSVPHQFHPVSVLKMQDQQLSPYLADQPLILRRQDKPPVYARNGPAVLIMKPQVIQRRELYGKPTVGYIMDTQSSIDIDTPEDLYLAELYLAVSSP